ncbi:MAG TPA: hypothetical protein VFX45_00615 [Solirubrobacterales bacterium]|nr:hypothetical protein [Solirubrobacterales bacterium]
MQQTRHILAAAIAAMALSWAFAASAGATVFVPVEELPEQRYHTVQSPTGPLVVPEILRFNYEMPDGMQVEGFVSVCALATAENQSYYTDAEVNASDRWCLEEPGTIQLNAKKQKKSKKGTRGNKAHTAKVGTRSHH